MLDFSLAYIYSKLGARINGFALLSLNESRLERLEVSMGFQFTLMSIIEDLVCDSWTGQIEYVYVIVITMGLM